MNVKDRRSRTGLRRILGGFWFNLLAACLVLVLVQTFVVKVFYVPTASMEQTLDPGDRVLVNRMSYVFGQPHDGDVIVFDASADNWGPPPPAPKNPVVYAIKWTGGVIGVGPTLNNVLIKRIIAGPGERVACCNARGLVTVGGKPAPDGYVFQDFDFTPGKLDCSTTPASLRCFTPITIPADKYFVLGDHRSDSDDSIEDCRGHDPTTGCLKLVARADIVGKAVVLAFPPNRWRTL